MPGLRPAQSLSRILSRFRRDERASLTVEFVVILPLIIWAFTATFSIYDVYRHKMLAIKGNYAISDLLSRETDPIDSAYLAGIEDVFEYFAKTTDSNAWLRITPVRCSSNCGNPATRQLRLDWSRATDGQPRLTASDVDTNYRDVVPIAAKGERIIMVESSVHYDPIFSSIVPWVAPFEIRDVVMTRPRFGPQLCWVAKTCLNS